MSEDKKDPDYAVWQDPSSYTHELHGPPYLPSQEAGHYKPAAQQAMRKAAHGKAASLHSFLEGLAQSYQAFPTGDLAIVLAFLRALGMVHQAHHWQTRGPNYYGDHLLYDRLYTDIVGELDSVAERTVGTADAVLVNPTMHAMHVTAIIMQLHEEAPMSLSAPDTYVQVSLQAETKFLLFMQLIAKRLKAKGNLSRGTDNLLAGIEDKHEEHLYLLQQRANK